MFLGDIPCDKPSLKAGSVDADVDEYPGDGIIRAQHSILMHMISLPDYIE